MATAVGEKRGAWKMIEGIRDKGEQPSTGLRHLYSHNKVVRRAVDRARRSMGRNCAESSSSDTVQGSV